MDKWRKELEEKGYKYYREYKGEKYFIDKDTNLIGIFENENRIHFIQKGKLVINYNLDCDKDKFFDKIQEYLNKSCNDYLCCIGCEYLQIRENKYYCWKGSKNPYGIMGSGFSTFTKKEKCDKGVLKHG